MKTVRASKERPTLSGRIIKESKFYLSIKPRMKMKWGSSVGFLTLTDKKLYFISDFKDVVLDIPLEDIRSADAERKTGFDSLVVRYEDGEVVRELRLSAPRLIENIAKLGLFSLITATDPLIAEWSKAINEARSRAPTQSPTKSEENPVVILKTRYAKGEITKAQFDKMNKELE